MKRDKFCINPLEIRGNLNEAIGELCRCLMIAWGDRCQRCHKKRKRFHIHHRDGCSLNWHIENVMLLCPKCHAKLQGKILPKRAHQRLEIIASYKIVDRIGRLIPNLSETKIASNLRKNQAVRQKIESGNLY